MTDLTYYRTARQPRVEDLIAAGLAAGDDVTLRLSNGAIVAATIEGAWSRYAQPGKKWADFHCPMQEASTAIVVRRPGALAPTKVLLKDIEEINRAG